MTDAPAAITAQLVDVRNVAAHKSVRLELHVPAEQAGLVMAAFGWPTMADPVPVALARLQTAPEPTHTTPEPGPITGKTGAVTRRFSELPYSQQAVLRCRTEMFQDWVAYRILVASGNDVGSSEGAAATYVRSFCGVQSRSEIAKGNAAGAKWETLEAEYYAWRVGMR